MEDLKSQKFVVGLKQSDKMVKSGKAKKAYVAKDAMKEVTAPFVRACEKRKIPIVYVQTMEELRVACGIEVGAAIAVIHE